MKHLTFILALLLVSVLSTACINNLAIQELNNNAKSYIDKGDTESAICRLKSSLELDNQVFETHYNLGIAYLGAKTYDKAQEELKAAIALNPEFTDAYYSIAVAQEEEAMTMESDYKTKNNTDKLDDAAKEAVIQKLNDAVATYTDYSKRVKKNEEIAKIQERIDGIKKTIETLSSDDRT